MVLSSVCMYGLWCELILKTFELLKLQYTHLSFYDVERDSNSVFAHTLLSLTSSLIFFAIICCILRVVI